MGDLEYQLMRIPSGTHDDLPDAEQILCRLLEYAPSIGKLKAPVDDPHFEWLRDRELKRKNSIKKKTKVPFAWGMKKTKLRELPAKESWR